MSIRSPYNCTTQKNKGGTADIVKKRIHRYCSRVAGIWILFVSKCRDESAKGIVSIGTRKLFYPTELVFYKRTLWPDTTFNEGTGPALCKAELFSGGSPPWVHKNSGNPLWNGYFFLASFFFLVLLDFLGGYCLTWSSLWTEGLSASNSMVTDSPKPDFRVAGNDAPTSQLSPFK